MIAMIVFLAWNKNQDVLKWLSQKTTSDFDTLHESVFYLMWNIRSTNDEGMLKHTHCRLFFPGTDETKASAGTQREGTSVSLQLPP